MSQITDELSAYEAQVLIGTSISGCNMSPDRIFDLKDAWARLYAMGLIDRTDGLAIATPKGGARIAAMLAAPALSTPPVGAETGEAVGWQHRIWFDDTQKWSDWRPGKARHDVGQRLRGAPAIRLPRSSQYSGGG